MVALLRPGPPPAASCPPGVGRLAAARAMASTVGFADAVALGTAWPTMSRCRIRLLAAARAVPRKEQRKLGALLASALRCARSGASRARTTWPTRLGAGGLLRPGRPRGSPWTTRCAAWPQQSPSCRARPPGSSSTRRAASRIRLDDSDAPTARAPRPCAAGIASLLAASKPRRFRHRARRLMPREPGGRIHARRHVHGAAAHALRGDTNVLDEGRGRLLVDLAPSLGTRRALVLSPMTRCSGPPRRRGPARLSWRLEPGGPRFTPPQRWRASSWGLRREDEAPASSASPRRSTSSTGGPAPTPSTSSRAAMRGIGPLPVGRAPVGSGDRGLFRARRGSRGDLRRGRAAWGGATSGAPH